MMASVSTVLTAVLLVVTITVHSALTKTLFFNSLGNCLPGQRGDKYSLKDESYTLQATGANEMHENLFCTMMFEAPANTGICLTFQHYLVDDCGVSLNIYQHSTASGKKWKKLTCEDRNPPQMCTHERYVTLQLGKTKLNKNMGYQFTVLVDKSSNFKGEDVILASSIGLFVGIIVGVVGFIVIIAVIVLCCCCKPCISKQLMQQSCKGAGDVPQGGLTGPPAQPTAPPAVEMEDELTPLQARSGSQLYPGLPLPCPVGYRKTEEPPPYAPPPYEQHSFAANV